MSGSTRAGPSLISSSSIVLDRSGTSFASLRGTSSSRIGCRCASKGAEDQRRSRPAGHAQRPREKSFYIVRSFSPPKTHSPSRRFTRPLLSGLRVSDGSVTGQSSQPRLSVRRQRPPARAATRERSQAASPASASGARRSAGVERGASSDEEGPGGDHGERRLSACGGIEIADTKQRDRSQPEGDQYVGCNDAGRGHWARPQKSVVANSRRPPTSGRLACAPTVPSSGVAAMAASWRPRVRR